jgi:hypothetical protein
MRHFHKKIFFVQKPLCQELDSLFIQDRLFLAYAVTLKVLPSRKSNINTIEHQKTKNNLSLNQLQLII